MVLLEMQRLAVWQTCSFDVGVSAVVLVFLLELPLLPVSGQVAVVPPLISRIVMGPLLLRHLRLGRLYCERHRVLSVWSVPHWPVTVLRPWPVCMARCLVARLSLLMLRRSEVSIRASVRGRRVDGLLKPGGRVINSLLLLPLLECL